MVVKDLGKHISPQARGKRGRSETRTVAGVKYALIDPRKVRDYVLSIAEKEWDPEDFEKFGEDLRQAKWRLRIVRVQDIKAQPALMRSEEFLRDLRPRIEAVSKRITERKPIPPLILERDSLVFDGYARLHALKDSGVKKCLAYVGVRRSHE